MILGVHPNQLNSHPNPKLLEAIHKKIWIRIAIFNDPTFEKILFLLTVHTEKSWEWSKAPFVPLNPFAKSVSFLMLCPFKNFLCLRFWVMVLIGFSFIMHYTVCKMSNFCPIIKIIAKFEQNVILILVPKLIIFGVKNLWFLVKMDQK